MKLFKSLSCLCMITGLLVLIACSPKSTIEAKPKGTVYFQYFDTVTNVYSYAGDSQEEFEARCVGVSEILWKYHQLFDIYHEYSGINNLCTLNKAAGGEAVELAPELIDFLLYAKEMYAYTDGEMNVMMGSVLRLWHNSREGADKDPQNASPPEESALFEAAKHCGIELLEIDTEDLTARISDPLGAIDVGALGKGYATEKAAEYLKGIGADGYVLNVGGNIRTIGTKPNGEGWATGAKNPKDTGSYLCYFYLSDTSCVTSGDYERFFVSEGRKYHHIIDKDTLYPSEYFSAVTVVTPDSAVADTLSTALFSMSEQDGRELIKRFDDLCVLWIYGDGTLSMTDGFAALVESYEEKNQIENN